MHEVHNRYFCFTIQKFPISRKEISLIFRNKTYILCFLIVNILNAFKD
jgi:hypothetical protein